MIANYQFRMLKTFTVTRTIKVSMKQISKNYPALSFSVHGSNHNIMTQTYT